MADEEKAPMWLALLSGAVVLGTGPLALALIITLSASGDGGAVEGFADLVRDGGQFSYAVLLAGAFASVVGAVLTGISVQRPALPAPLALIPFLLTSIAAVAGVVLSLRQVAAAIVHVNPADKGVILMAGSGEIVSLSVQGLSFAAAGAFSVAFAALISLAARPRGPRVVSMLGAGVLGLCLAVMTAQAFFVREGFKAVSMASPGDRAILFGDAIEHWIMLNRLGNGLFLSSLAIAALGGALVAARGQRAAGIGAAVTLVVAAVGSRGFNATAERQLSSVTLPPSPQLMVVEGIEPSREYQLALRDDRTESIDEAVAARLAEHDMEDNRAVGVELATTLQPATVLRVMQVAHLGKASWVELVGEAPRIKVEVPPLFAAPIELLNHVPRAAPARVLFADEACEKCVAARISKTGLQVGDESWTGGEERFYGAFDKLPGVEAPFVEDVEALTRASLAALAHERVLVVRVPLPEPLPKPDSVDLLGGE